ncbi:MAG: PilZ domain-containing protein [Candidatus Omnitrophota bacterium]
MEKGFSEKREAPRLRINYLMRYGKENSLARFHAFFNDISEKGIRFLSKENLPKATPLYIELSSDEKPISLNGRVVWQNSLGRNFYELGVNFEEVPPEKKKLLIRYIDNLKNKLS